MKAKIFTLHFDSQSRMIDDRALVGFLERRRLVSMTEYLVRFDDEPMLVVSITYCDDDVLPQLQAAAPARVNKSDELDPVARDRYEALRQWRNSKAEALGRPAFTLLTNRHLADIATMRPLSLSELGTIPGIGEARIASHGHEIMELLSGLGSVADGARPSGNGVNHE